MQPLVKIEIPTYRRPALLPRALTSLRAQSFTAWTAQVRNDDPGDPRPAALVAAMGDSRITCTTHETNLGAVETFNRCYAPGPEPFFALLEDDNAWEPSFLETMLAVLEANPEAALAWCDQHLDEEQADGTVVPLGRTTGTPDGSTRLRPFGEPAQAFGALHANGAMLLRRRTGHLATPPMPFAGVETFRERLLSRPMVHHAAPLGRFTVTRASARDAERWGELQTALVASFARACPAEMHPALWAHARSTRPSMTGLLVAASFADPACRALRRHARPWEFLLWMAGAIRSPRATRHALSCTKAAWWPALAETTARRFTQTRPALK